MAWGAATVLARGWWRGLRRWWLGTALVLALVQVLLLSVSSVFAGMEAATEDRVAAFFTGDVRVTPGQPAAAPDVYWVGAEAERVERELAAAGATVVPRLESQFVLSRRTLVEAYLQEDEQYRIRTPGGDVADTDFYGIGVLVGIDTEGPGVDPLRPYLMDGGRFPRLRNDTVELVMSVTAFEAYVGDRSRFSAWPPPTPELETVRFEVTTARIDPDSPFKDLIRRPARVVGLFETRLDALDAFTMVAHRDAVAGLLDMEGEGAVNAFSVHGPAPPMAGEGWGVEDAEGFAARYVGQMVEVVRALGLFLAVLFITIPLFLVWHGLGQLLQMHHREYAVCRAIGVGRSTMLTGLAVLVGTVSLLAVAAATLLMLGVAAAADPVLGRYDLPLPVRFALPPSAVAATLAAVALAMAVAVAAAMRRIGRQDLATALRAA